MRALLRFNGGGASLGGGAQGGGRALRSGGGAVPCSGGESRTRRYGGMVPQPGRCTLAACSCSCLECPPSSSARVPHLGPPRQKPPKSRFIAMRAASPKRGTPRASSPKRSTPTKLPKPPLSRRSAKLDPSPRGPAADGERVKVIVRLRPAMSEVETANSFSHDERQVARPATGPGRPCRVSTRYPTPNA